jgi:hypothetical protein
MPPASRVVSARSTSTAGITSASTLLTGSRLHLVSEIVFFASSRCSTELVGPRRFRTTILVITPEIRQRPNPRGTHSHVCRDGCILRQGDISAAQVDGGHVLAGVSRICPNLCISCNYHIMYELCRFILNGSCSVLLQCLASCKECLGSPGYFLLRHVQQKSLILQFCQAKLFLRTLLHCKSIIGVPSALI